MTVPRLEPRFFIVVHAATTDFHLDAMNRATATGMEMTTATGAMVSAHALRRMFAVVVHAVFCCYLRVAEQHKTFAGESNLSSFVPNGDSLCQTFLQGKRRRFRDISGNVLGGTRLRFLPKTWGCVSLIMHFEK